jgi:hypothetical protein
MLQQRRLLTPAWSKGPYKPTACTKSALTVLGCELGQTTAPRSGSPACRVAKCNQYEFDFTDAACSRFGVYACSGSVVNIFADVWAIRAPMNGDCSASMYLQNFSDTLLANMRRTIEERATMCRQKGYKPAGYIPAIFAPSACGIPS